MNWTEKNSNLIDSFIRSFSSKGYDPLPSVAVTSRIDPTVYLVNSATNLFKPFFNKSNIHIVTAQKSMRTQILNDYYCKSRETKYPSCFISLGAYASFNFLDQLIFDSYMFLLNTGFNDKKIRVRVCPKDTMLVNSVRRVICNSQIELDEDFEKYAHSYGGNATGRVIKLDCFSERYKRYKNIGYVIAIFNDGLFCGAEFASSCEQILMRLNDEDYAISVASIADYYSSETFEDRRLADSIMGAITLVHEGIHPNSSNTNGRTLKKYLAAISHFKNVVLLPNSEIYDLSIAYYLSQYGETIPNNICKSFSALYNVILSDI